MIGSIVSSHQIHVAAICSGALVSTVAQTVTRRITLTARAEGDTCTV